MTGFLLLGLLSIVLVAALRLSGIRGPVLTLSSAAILFGCAGYAVQGTPGLPGAPREAAQRKAPLPLSGARQALLGQFDASDNWLNMADALSARGKSEDAARLLATQVENHPSDFKLWIGLGNALADHAETLSPAARLAFRRAAELAPGHPAPPFFLGLAEARSGNPEAARALWVGILAKSPADVSWRPMVEQGLVAIGGSAGPPPTRQAQAGS